MNLKALLILKEVCAIELIEATTLMKLKWHQSIEDSWHHHQVINALE